MDAEIPLPADLRDKIEREATARGMSLPDFVRTSLEWAMAKKPYDDPLFADRAVYCDDGPEDMAEKHDDYLYGDGS